MSKFLEWKAEEAKVAWREEVREETREETREEIAHNALVEGASIEFIQRITGLDMGTIQNIQAGM